VFLSSGWYDAGQLDGRLSQSIRFDQGLAVHFGQETKLTIAACVRLLTYADAFVSRGLPVELHDLANWGLGSYLDRIGVFDQLGPQVSLMGLAPGGLAQSRRGQSHGLEEIVRVAPSGPMDKGVVARLAGKLAACATPDLREALENAAFLYFGELIDNVRNHSQSVTPGYAALQVYTPRTGSRRMVEVVVADAGAGILGTLRPVLLARSPLGQLDDQALLLHAVNSGISKDGDRRRPSALALPARPASFDEPSEPGLPGRGGRRGTACSHQGLVRQFRCIRRAGQARSRHDGVDAAAETRHPTLIHWHSPAPGTPAQGARSDIPGCRVIVTGIPPCREMPCRRHLNA